MKDLALFMYGEPYRLKHRRAPYMARGRLRLGLVAKLLGDPSRWVRELGNNYLFIKYTKIT